MLGESGRFPPQTLVRNDKRSQPSGHQHPRAQVVQGASMMNSVAGVAANEFVRLADDRQVRPSSSYASFVGALTTPEMARFTIKEECKRIIQLCVVGGRRSSCLNTNPIWPSDRSPGQRPARTRPGGPPASRTSCSPMPSVSNESTGARSRSNSGNTAAARRSLGAHRWPPTTAGHSRGGGRR